MKGQAFGMRMISSVFRSAAVAAAALMGLVAAMALPAGPALAQEPAADVVSRHGDWLLSCQGEGEARSCALTQRLVSPEDKSFLAELGLNMIRTDEGVRPLLIAVVPNGVALQVQPGYSIDGADLVPLVWQVCFGEVCRAYRPLSEEELAAIRAGNTLKFGFQPFGARQGVNVDFSLSGVTAGLKALTAR